MICDSFSGELLLTRRRVACVLQISVKNSANARFLQKSSFKHSINTYWVTSLEASGSLWSEELAPSSVEVEKFRMRVHDGSGVMSFFTFGDCFEHFLQQWETSVSRLALHTGAL